MLLAGCADDEPFEVVLDVRGCFEQAAAAPCGAAFTEHLDESTRACLYASGPGGSRDLLTFGYDPEARVLRPLGGTLVLKARMKQLVDFELLVLRPGEEVCPGAADEGSPSAHPACLLSFGSVAVQMPEGGTARVAFSGEEGGGCSVACHADCVREACNGRDDDCDGAVDEGFGVGDACELAGRCGSGALECGEAKVRCDTGPGGSRDRSSAERCNGEDDDCDGLVDEADDLVTGGDAGWECGSAEGTCRPGVSACVGGEVVCEGETPPEAETCDGLDNDCDGETDEGFGADVDGLELPVGSRCAGAGACGAGEVVCTADGTAACCSTALDCGFVGRAEECDGLDNDCDGETDELSDLSAAGVVGGACGTDVGECRVGITSCLAGRSVCLAGVSPLLETCDGLDNDCDGETDERGDLAGAGLVAVRCGQRIGECSLGIQECREGALVCERAVGPQPETCDGLDNDCDGETDDPEDLVAAGLVEVPCGLDEGECRRGTRVCAGRRLVCQGEVAPADEVCDGLDNDCDGETDEADDLAAAGLVGMACGSDRGACSQGTVTCDGGRLVCAGAVDPEAEACDGQDNDCDGVTDEGNPGGGDACGESDGVCRQGVRTCVEGDLLCLGGVEPADERCDGLDNDCDGEVDEDWAVGDEALGELCGDPGADCGGTWVCDRDGTGTCCSGDPACGFAPGAELCDGVDNDCDGRTDEGWQLGAPCEGTGECGEGVAECGDDPLSTRCSTDPGGSDHVSVFEACDGLDNDCDGETDEGFHRNGRQLGEPCEGEGSCGGGLVECAGAVAVRCSTEPGGSQDEAGPEVCDGGDNDCDGETDEGFLMAGVPLGGPCDGVGACGLGMVECAGPDGTRCSTEPGGSADEAVEEDCNAADDDCDGQTDEGFGLGQACDGPDDDQCAFGTLACNVAGDGVVCANEQPSDVRESCNGDDDDCDGEVDEGDPDGGGACGSGVGACEPGVQVCRGGALVCEGGTGPSVETCNGRDDDCDGEADEGDPGGGELCGSDVGECRQGVSACLGGEVVCVGAMAPRTELCNGADDDCDGQADEDFSAGDGALGAACGDPGGCAGFFVCSADGGGTCCSGDAACIPEAERPDELCDGADNDCDEETDEGFSLGAPCAGAGACPAGTVECADDPRFARCSSLSGGSEYAGGPELCNGEDDDCDGVTDEGFLFGGGGVGAPCAGVGVCAAGTVECGDDAQSARCSSLPGGSEYAGGPELCDGADDDCDGDADEDFPLGAGCDGGDEDLCAHGTWTCRADGAGVECVDEDPEDLAEVCNGEDDDCDGVVDEGDPGGGELCGSDVGECVAGITVCDAGEVVCAGDTDPAAERCDGLDNDCDGVSDEDYVAGEPSLGTPCDGADSDRCENGVWACTADGAGVVCGPESPEDVAEACGDGMDDDCDGQTDEGCCPVEPDYVVCDPGEPATGYDVCVGDACISPGCGELSCNTPGPPWPRLDPVRALAIVDPLGNGEEVVEDAATGLAWQRQPLGDGNPGPTWAEAVEHCRALEHAGTDDWRLPSLHEHLTLLDYTAPWPLLVGQGAGPGGEDVLVPSSGAGGWWTATAAGPGGGGTLRAWFVRFNGRALATARSETTGAWLRCVRGVPLGGEGASEPRWATRSVGGDGVAADAWSGLEWQQSDDAARGEDVDGHCGGLTYAGLADWRAPEIAELASLFDPRVAEGARLDTTVFPEVRAQDHWARTLKENDATKQWKLSFGSGEIRTAGVKGRRRILCVREP